MGLKDSEIFTVDNNADYITLPVVEDNDEVIQGISISNTRAFGLIDKKKFIERSYKAIAKKYGLDNQIDRPKNTKLAMIHAGNQEPSLVEHTLLHKELLVEMFSRQSLTL